MKKLLIIFLIINLIFIMVGCTKNKETPKVEKEDKPTLLFEVDEGLGMNELTTYFDNGSYSQNVAIYNIIDGLAPLSDKYHLAVLIYPQWHYYENGYNGQDPSKPLNRISDNLKHVIEVFGENDIDVYLELISSGIVTSQNGEVIVDNYAKPCPPVHYGDSKKYYGISMDMECLIALASEYSNVKGVRFHEMIGTHDIGLAGNNHGTTFSKELVEEVFKGIRDSGLDLVWGDHSWNLVADKNLVLDDKHAFWKEWLDLAIEIIGSDKITLNWSNNGWPVSQYITDTFHFKNYSNTTYGESVQSWFWQELDCGTMQWNPNDTGFTTKWYSYANCDMPVELIAAFTLRAFSNGAKLVQYEHPQYFFNFFEVSGGKSTTYTGTTDGVQDYSVKLRTKRLISMLLGENSYSPEIDLTKYFANTNSNINSYKTSNSNCKRYYQNSIFMLTDDSYDVYDKYNSEINKWYHNNEDRLLSGEYEDVEFATRMNITFSATEERLILKKSNQGYSGYFYNHYNGLLATDEITFNDNSNGKVVDVIPLNLISKYVDGLDGDPDELIIVRDNGVRLNLEYYEVRTSAKNIFSLYPVVVNTDITQYIEANLPNRENYIRCLPIKKSIQINEKALRPMENGVVFIYNEDGKLSYNGKVDTKLINGKLNILTKDYLCITQSDNDMDFDDDLMIAYKDGNNTKIQSYYVGDSSLINDVDVLEIEDKYIKVMYSGRICMYKQSY